MSLTIQSDRDPRYTASLEWLQKSDIRAQLAKEYLGKWLVAVDRAIVHAADSQTDALTWIRANTPAGVAVLWYLQVETRS